MKLSAPKKVTWFIALALAVIALIGFTNIIAAISPFAFWFALVSAALMLVATLVKGL